MKIFSFERYTQKSQKYQCGDYNKLLLGNNLQNLFTDVNFQFWDLKHISQAFQEDTLMCWWALAIV